MIDTDEMLTAVFNEINEERTGKIDISEYFLGLSQFVEDPTFDVAKALFKLIDDDHDNFITLEQFKELVHFTVKHSNDEDEFSVLFMKCNQHGFVSLEHVISIVHAINAQIQTETIQHHFTQNDQNTDGMLNWSEYMKCVEHFRYE